MKKLLTPFVLLIALAAVPAFAQVPNRVDVAQQVEQEGYFERCRAGEMRGCSYFARLVALRLNPTADPNGFGWLTKSPGESNVDGYADDAIVFGQGQTNVVDLVGGSGAPGARVQWGGPHPRRAHNVWEAPRPLTASEMEYLKTGSGSTPGTPTPPTPQPPTNLQPILDRLKALEDLVRELHGKHDRQDQQLSTIEAAADAAAHQAIAAREAIGSVVATADDTRKRVEDVLTAVDLARQQLANPPEYSGRVPIGGGTVTLRPRK